MVLSASRKIRSWEVGLVNCCLLQVRLTIVNLSRLLNQEEKAPQTNGKEANPEEIHDDDDVCEEEANQGSSSRSSDGASNAKIKIYLHQRVEKNLEDKLRVSKLK